MSIGWLALLCAVWCIGHNQGKEEMISYKNNNYNNYIVVLHNPYSDGDSCRLWFHEEEEQMK